MWGKTKYSDSPNYTGFTSRYLNHYLYCRRSHLFKLYSVVVLSTAMLRKSGVNNVCVSTLERRSYRLLFFEFNQKTHHIHHIILKRLNPTICNSTRNVSEERSRESCCPRVSVISTGLTKDWYPGLLGVYSLLPGSSSQRVYKMTDSKRLTRTGCPDQCQGWDKWFVRLKPFLML